MGAVLGLKAFAVAIIGGLSSGMGVIVGGVIFGIAETTTGFYLSTGYKDVPGLVLLLLVLRGQARGPLRQDGHQESMNATAMPSLAVKRPNVGLPLWAKAVGIVIALVALALFPIVVPNTYYIHLGETIMIYAILLFGLDIVVGYTGQVSLGHAGLFGIGAYTAGMCSSTSSARRSSFG